MKNVLYICIGAFFAVLACSSCNDDIDIRQDYDFILSSWYLQKQIATGETVEIRFYLDREEMCIRDRKFYGVAAVLSLLCAGFIWFIFCLLYTSRDNQVVSVLWNPS